ncbi:hypothetical protein AMTRI_Chr05g60940 [Amborella trichopoda]
MANAVAFFAAVNPRVLNRPLGLGYIRRKSQIASIYRFQSLRAHRSLVFASKDGSPLSVDAHLEGSNMQVLDSQATDSINYQGHGSSSQIEESLKSYSTVAEEVSGKHGMNTSVDISNTQEEGKKTARIHDFCLGIPFGGIVLSGGLVGFIFSRNITNLMSGILFGGALLALSYYSLKVWKQGKSSIPFMVGQTAFTAAYLVKQFQLYSLTRKLLPNGFFIALRY